MAKAVAYSFLPFDSDKASYELLEGFNSAQRDLLIGAYMRLQLYDWEILLCP